MNFKIIYYRCGCKYIFIIDKEKRIFKNYTLCPTHEHLISRVVLWCKDCGLKITETEARTWQRKKRCLPCRDLKNLNRTKANWALKKARNNLKTQTCMPEVNPKERLALLSLNSKKISLRKLYRAMDRVLPVVETPILDGWGSSG